MSIAFDKATSDPVRVQAVGILVRDRGKTLFVAESGKIWTCCGTNSALPSGTTVYAEGELEGHQLNVRSIREFMTSANIDECAAFLEERYGPDATKRARLCLVQRTLSYPEQLQWLRIIQALQSFPARPLLQT